MTTKTKTKKLIKTTKASKYTDDEGAWLDESFADGSGVEFILDGKVVLKLDHDEAIQILDAIKTIASLSAKIQL